MAEIVRRKSEAAIELNLEIIWEVIEIATETAVQHLLMKGMSLVAIARSSPRVMTEIRGGSKIRAIRELRIVSSAGLKEAKDAVDSIWDEDGISSSGAAL